MKDDPDYVEFDTKLFDNVGIDHEDIISDETQITLKEEMIRTIYLTRHHVTSAGQVKRLPACHMIKAKIMKYNPLSCLLVAKFAKFVQGLLNRSENSS